MALRDIFDEAPQHIEDIRKCLARARFREEGDKINWMAFMHGHANFGIAFEATYARPMACTGVDNDNRRLRLIEALFETSITDPGNTEQNIIGRMWEPAGIGQHLVVEVEQRRFASPLMRDHVVCALPERIPE